MNFLTHCNSTKIKPHVHVVANGELHSINWSKLPLAVVCNTEKRGRGRGHWLLIMMMHYNEVIYFDSFGVNLYKYKLVLPKFFNNCKMISNVRQVQPHRSLTCGLFVLYVYYNLIRKRPYPQLIETDFSMSSLKYNDTVVISFYNKLSFCVKC